MLNKLNIFIFGDFNFPNLCWKSLTPKRDSSLKSSTDLINFMDKYFLSQYIEENTRKNNILDLFITNNPLFSQVIETSEIDISDHNLIKIYTPFFSKLFDMQSVSVPSVNSNLDFSQFNLESADFTKINQHLHNTDWTWINECDIEIFPKNFHHIVHSALSKHCKLKSQNKHFCKGHKFFNRQLDVINRKIHKYKRRLKVYNITQNKYNLL